MRLVSELKSKQNDFQVQCGRHQSTLMFELLVMSGRLNSAESLCLSQISPFAPFKLDIKEERKEEEKQRQEMSLISIKPKISLAVPG